MNNILIAYYSFSGTTKAMADRIAAETGGELLALIPEMPYDFSRNTASKEVRGEIARGFCPKLLSEGTSIEVYSTIFVGTPNWFKGMAPPLLTYLRSHDFADKTVLPFCTHGGGGLGEIEARTGEECKPAAPFPGLAGTADISQAELEERLCQVGGGSGG